MALELLFRPSMNIDTASLPLPRAFPRFQREQERKYLLSDEDAECFLWLVQKHVYPVIHDRQRPIAHTRTTYFAAPGCSYRGFLRMNHQAPDQRTESRRRFLTELLGSPRRIRLREYASAEDLGQAPQLTSVAFLEFKRRYKTLRTKRRIKLDSSKRRRVLRLGLAQGRLRPTLVTCYQRSSYAAHSAPVRITLDRNVSIHRPSLHLSKLGSPFGQVKGVVLEIKYVGRAPEWMHHLRRELAEYSSFSKFRFGVLSSLSAATSLR